MTEEVNHPAHYGGDVPYETIKVIEAWYGYTFHLPSAIKYISRIDKKDTWERNIDKAIWYLERYKQVRKESERDERHANMYSYLDYRNQLS